MKKLIAYFLVLKVFKRRLAKEKAKGLYYPHNFRYEDYVKNYIFEKTC